MGCYIFLKGMTYSCQILISKVYFLKAYFAKCTRIMHLLLALQVFSSKQKYFKFSFLLWPGEMDPGPFLF